MSDGLDDFSIGDELGRGTTGTVYTAVHRPTGVRVALKTVRTQSRAMAISLDREVAAMVRMYHPHILFLFDHGVAGPDSPLGEGMAWMALEFASGGSLLDRRPRSWREASALALALLDGLAYAHGRGIVHRDLKPENVVVATGADLRPGIKIADFGLAWATDNDRRGIRRGGTPAYITPEQVRGSVTELGPWTDLYSLGAMLWDWITGDAPFGTELPVDELLNAHLHRALPPLEPRFAVPDGLEQVLQALLAKSVNDRPRSAALVARQLMALESVHPDSSDDAGSGPDLSWLDTVVLDRSTLGLSTRTADGDGSSPVVVVSRRGGRLPVPKDWRGNTPAPSALLAGVGLGLLGRRALTIQGRTSERDSLWTALRDVARTERPRVVMLAGEEGVGASRLADWVLERVRELGIGEAHRVDRERGMVGTVERAFGVVAALGDVELPASATDRDRRVFETRAEPRAKDVAAWLIERSREGLVVLHVDDPEGDGELERLVTDPLFDASVSDEPCALLVIATGRPDAGLLEELAYLERAETLEVAPLPFEAMRDLAHYELGLDGRLGIRLAHDSSGRPATLVRWVRDLVESGGLVAGEDGFELAEGATLPSPSSQVDTAARFTAFWEQRTSSASAAAREAVAVGALLGMDVDLEEWRGALKLLGLPRSDTVLRQLVRAGWVARTATRWRFRTPVAREGLLQGLDEGQERDAHLAIAAALNVLEATPARAARRGMHLLAAGHTIPGVRVLGPALWNLVESRQVGIVEAICERAFRLVDLDALTPRQRFDLELPWLSARRQSHSGRVVQNELLGLVELVPQLAPEQRERLILMASEVCALLHDNERAEELVELLEPGSQRPFVFRLRGLLAQNRGDLEAARSFSQQAWDATDDPKLQGALANALGRLEAQTDNLEAAEKWFLRASTTVDVHQRGVVHGNLAILRLLAGRPDEALQSARQAWSLRWDGSLRLRSWYAMVALVCGAACNDLPLVQQAREPAVFYVRRFPRRADASLTSALAEQAFETARGHAASALQALIEAARNSSEQ